MPAHDLDAEAVVLSALLVSPDRFCDVQPILTSRAFYSDANRRIFEAIEDLDRDGKGIDVTAIATVLRDQDRLAQVGGTPYLAQLLEATPATAHVEDHARTVAGKAHQRRLVAELQTHAAEGYGDVGNPWDWAQRVEEAVYRVSAERLAESEDGTLAAVVPEVLDEVQARARGEAEPPGISTGFRLLDERINGLKRAKTYVVAGRPGMGKTALIGQIGTNIAAGAEPMFVVEISTEQKRSELALRKLAQCSGVAYTALEAGRISADGWERVVVESERLRKLPLAIEYMVAPTVGELRSAVRRALGRLRKAFGSLPIGLLSFDQIQHFDGKRSRGETRESEVAQLSREITWLAGEFDCPVMLAAQLNRGVEERPDKRPVPSDLRESGAIEQDAYGIFFPFRPRYYERQERGVSNSESVAVEECEVIIGKHKNGPAGSVAFTFHGPSMAFDTPDEYARAGAQQAMSFRGEQPPEDG